MSLPDINEKPTAEEKKYLAECEKEADDFIRRIKSETGYEINGSGGITLLPRFMFADSSKWPDYAANVLKIVKEGKRGAELYAALQALELQYPIMI